MTDAFDRHGSDADPAGPVASPGITLTELAVMVLGAAIGAWPLYEVFDLMQTVGQRVLGVVLFALTGVLMAGPIVLMLRLIRTAPVGPADIVWTILGTTVAPLFWVGTWLLHAETPIARTVLSLVHPVMTHGWWVAVPVAAVGTALTVYERWRNRRFSWVGLLLSWVWVACMLAATAHR